MSSSATFYHQAIIIFHLFNKRSPNETLRTSHLIQAKTFFLAQTICQCQKHHFMLTSESARSTNAIKPSDNNPQTTRHPRDWAHAKTKVSTPHHSCAQMSARTHHYSLSSLHTPLSPPFPSLFSLTRPWEWRESKHTFPKSASIHSTSQSKDPNLPIIILFSLCGWSIEPSLTFHLTTQDAVRKNSGM